METKKKFNLDQKYSLKFTSIWVANNHAEGENKDTLWLKVSSNWVILEMTHWDKFLVTVGKKLQKPTTSSEEVVHSMQTFIC